MIFMRHNGREKDLIQDVILGTVILWFIIRWDTEHEGEGEGDDIFRYAVMVDVNEFQSVSQVRIRKYSR